MNVDRRKIINAALAKIEEAKAELQGAADEERDYYDAMPDAFQNGERGENAQACFAALEEAVDYLEEAVSTVEGMP